MDLPEKNLWLHIILKSKDTKSRKKASIKKMTLIITLIPFSLVSLPVLCTIKENPFQDELKGERA